MALKGVMATLTIVAVIAALVIAAEIAVEEENGFNIPTSYGRDIIGHGERMITQLIPTKRMTRKLLKTQEIPNQPEEPVLPPPVPECVDKPCADDPNICKPHCRCAEVYQAGPENRVGLENVEEVEPEIKCLLKDETDTDTDEEE